MTEQEQMNELIDKVYQWGVDRKIIGNGKLETQWLKLLSEFGEMCDTLAKGGDPIDDIGDQLVVLIMMAGIDNGVEDFKELMPHGMVGEWQNINSVQNLCNEYEWLLSDYCNSAVESCLEDLCIIAGNHNHTLYQCLEHAYNQIKDRKCYLNKQGVFIKE